MKKKVATGVFMMICVGTLFTGCGTKDAPTEETVTENTVVPLSTV
mgnify:CR=1 FL=1